MEIAVVRVEWYMNVIDALLAVERLENNEPLTYTLMFQNHAGV